MFPSPSPAAMEDPPLGLFSRFVGRLIAVLTSFLFLAIGWFGKGGRRTDGRRTGPLSLARPEMIYEPEFGGKLAERLHLNAPNMAIRWGFINNR